MGFQDLAYDAPAQGQLLAAAQRAIVQHFDESDWTEVAYETGTQQFVLNHDRLLRSLHFQDNDYGACVFQALRYFTQYSPQALEAVLRHPKIYPELERNVPVLLARIGLLSGHVAPVPPAALMAPEVVARALKDADVLLASSGPISCIDRLHTALHGYLRAVAAPLNPREDASLTALFKLLRTSHSALNAGETPRILGGFAAVVDALNTIRNNASVAHPNETLLGEAEAHLMVNAVRTLFHYLTEKLEGRSYG